MGDDFRDFVAELLRSGARFLIVGAHAVAVHGVPRATVDLDVWIDASPDNARKLWTALAAFGAPLESLALRESDFIQPDTVIQLGVPPYRIDVLTSLSGVGFGEAWPDRIEADFAGVLAPFIGREALIRNKRASGRHKDLADIEALGED